MTQPSDPRQKSPLLGIITGMEHSGTTALAQLVISNCPSVNAGFEIGVLLCKASPRTFSQHGRFYEWLCEPTANGHWGLTTEQRDEVCQAHDWDEFYVRLMKASPVFTAQHTHLVDKAPAYAYILKDVLRKVSNVPIVVVHKPIVALYGSYRKRNMSLRDFANRYREYRRSLQRVISDDRIMTVSHGDLCERPADVLHDVCAFLGVDVDHSVSTDLDWNLAPIRKDYSAASELQQAKNSLSVLERTVLGLIDFGFRPK